LEVKPLNLEEIKKLIEDCAKDYETFGDAKVDAAFIEIRQCIESACKFYTRYKDRPHLLIHEYPKYEKRIKELMAEDKFADKLDRKIQTLSRRIADFSAHEFEKGRWWGDDTELGDLSFAIRKELAKFSDWILKNYNSRYNNWLFKLAFGELDDDM